MIKKIRNIILIGTSHISKESSNLIEKTITLENPEVVAIELDKFRLKSLLSSKKEKNSLIFLLKEFGIFTGFFCYTLSTFQKSIGKKIGVDVGIDMKKAYNVAKKNLIEVALIDIEIHKTMKEISKLNFKKKMSLIFSIFKRENIKEARKISLELNPKNGLYNEKTINDVIKFLKKTNPQLYEILIDKRNKYMCEKILELEKKYKKIVVVVGAGHIFGMSEILENSFQNQSNNITFSFRISNDT